MELRDTRSKYLIAGIASLIPAAAICLIWGHINKAYPYLDPAFYILASQKITLQLKLHGLASYLHALYALRDPQKPILHPAIGSIFLLFTGGKVLSGICLAELAYYLTFLSFCFLGFALFLPPLECAVAVVLISLLPWCIQGAHFFDAEIPLLTFCAASAYWLARIWVPDRERITKGALGFGIFFGLGLCTRPAEMLLFLIGPLLIWVGVNLRKKNLRPLDLGCCVLMGLPFLYLLHRCSTESLEAVQGWSAFARWVFLCSPAVLIFIFKKQLRLNTSFCAAVGISQIVMCTWFAPFLRTLYEWLYINSYGYMAATVRASYPISTTKFLTNIWSELGGLPLLVLAAAGLLGLVRKKPNKAATLALGAAVFAIIFPQFIGATSYNPSIRYYLPSAVLCHALFLYFALSSGGLLRKVRVSLVAAVAVYAAGWNLAAIWLPTRVSAISTSPHDIYLSDSPAPRRSQDEAVTFIHYLESHLSDSLPGKKRIGLIPLELPEAGGFFNYDWTGLSVISLELGHDWSFFPWGSDHAQSCCDAFVYGPLEGQVPPDTPALAKIPETSWDLVGWKPIKNFSLPWGENRAGNFVLTTYKPPSLARSWKTIPEIGPERIPGLTLYFNAKQLSREHDGDLVPAWQSSGPLKLQLSPPQGGNAPTFASTGANGHPAVRFAEGAYLQSPAFAGASAFGPNQFTIATVLFPENSRSTTDLFGWGDCQNQRLVFETLQSGKFLEVQMGSPSSSRMGELLPSDWNNHLHVIILSRSGKHAELIIDGVLTRASEMMESDLSSQLSAAFMLGNSPCQNGFTGLIAETAVYRRALSKTETRSLTKYLGARYGVPLGEN